MEDREFWLQIREAALHFVDIVERRLAIHPTTADLRRAAKLSNK